MQFIMVDRKTEEETTFTCDEIFSTRNYYFLHENGTITAKISVDHMNYIYFIRAAE